MKMNKLIAIFLSVCALTVTASCNRNNEPPSESAISITDAYLPKTIAFERSDSLLFNKCKDFNNKQFVVNSYDELPADPLGFNSSYSTIDFSKNALLLVYKIQHYTIDTYRNRYVRNNIENTYDWTISIGTSTSEKDVDMSKVYFTRFAIVVPKLVAGFELKTWFSVYYIGQ